MQCIKKCIRKQLNYSLRDYSSLHRRHFKWNIFFLNKFVSFGKKRIHESSCIQRIREREGGEGKIVGTCATWHREVKKKKKGKRHGAVCLLLIYRGAHSLFRYYGLSTSFSTCTDCDLHSFSSSSPANQFNDFARPPSPSRTRNFEISKESANDRENVRMRKGRIIFYPNISLRECNCFLPSKLKILIVFVR